MVKSKDNCAKHLDYILKYSGSLDELAKDLGNLRYDSLADFLQLLGDDLIRQAEADRGRGRVKLAGQLEKTAQELYSAKEKMELVWKICEPYMNSK